MIERKKFYEPYEIGGIFWSANACKRCNKFFPPYLAAVPMENVDEYCWGHEIEDAVKPYRDLLEKLVILHGGAHNSMYIRDHRKLIEQADELLQGDKYE